MSMGQHGTKMNHNRDNYNLLNHTMRALMNLSECYNPKEATN